MSSEAKNKDSPYLNYPEEVNKESSAPFLPKSLSPSLIIQSDSEKGLKEISQCELDVESEFKKSKESLEKPLGWKKYIGVIFTLLSTNSFSLASTIMKKVSYLHPFNLGVYSFPVSALLTVPFILYTIFKEKKSVLTNIVPIGQNKKNIFIMWCRTVMSCMISYLLIFTFKYITVADTRTILASSVITVYFFGWLFLGEECGVVPIITALMALLGIGIMTRPPILTGADSFDSQTLTGVGLAFGCMLCATIIIISIRLIQGVHHGFMNLFLYVWGTAQSVALAFGFGVFEIPRTGGDLGILIAVGALLVMGNTFLVLALQCEEAGVVALIRTSEVIFTFFWQMVILGVYPDAISIVGAILVVTGVVVVTLRKRLASLPEDDPTRKRFQLLLR